MINIGKIHTNQLGIKDISFIENTRKHSDDQFYLTRKKSAFKHFAAKNNKQLGLV